MDRDEENPDSSLKCIEEYYRKFSRDSNLHKYFSGTSVSYLPPLRLDDDLVENPEGPASSKKSEMMEKDGEKSENISIISGKSEHSEKKLEWDSGADIGYHNYSQLKKQIPTTGLRSLSLPTLKDLEDTKITFHPATHVNLPPTKSQSLSTKTSSSSNKQAEVYLLSYSSSPVPTSSRHSSATSQITEKGNTMSSESSSSEKYNSNASSEQQSLKSKVAHLSDTLNILKLAIGLPDAFSTPILSENAKSGSQSKCSSSLRKQTVKKRYSREKLSEKTISNSPSKRSFSLRKRTSSRGVHKEKPQSKVVNLTLSTPVTVQCVVDKPPEKQVKVQSDGHESGQVPVKLKDQTSDSDANISHCESFEYFDGNSGVPLQSKAKQLDLKNDKVVNDSTVLSDDIDKAVSVIHQFFESHPLSYSRKRRYIKKIIHRIESKFQTRFLEDSSSNQTDTSGMHTPSQVENKKNDFLDRELGGDKSHSDPGPSKALEHVFKLPDSLSLPDAAKKRNSPNIFDISEKVPASENTSSEVSARINKENPEDTPSDCVLNFVKNEKAYQISWINNEINHLTKLKKLLEHTEDLRHHKNIDHKDVKIDNIRHKKSKTDSKNVKKTYYKLTSTSGESEEEKNFVIETRMDFDSRQQTIFQLDGKKYSVEDTSTSQEIISEEGKHCIINDIEVETKESVTNIKITSSCEECKSSNCLCEEGQGNENSGSQSDVTSKDQNEIQDYYDSLKKIFNSCQCIKGDKCRCIFVKNILRYFGDKNMLDAIPNETQTETHSADAKTQTASNMGSIGIQSKPVTNTAETNADHAVKIGVSQTLANKEAQPMVSQSIQASNQTNNAATEAAIFPDCSSIQVQTKAVPRVEKSNQVTSKLEDLATQSNGVWSIPQSIQTVPKETGNVATQAVAVPNYLGVSATSQTLEIPRTERSNQVTTDIENQATQSKAALSTNQTQTNVPNLETASQTKTLETGTTGIQVHSVDTMPQNARVSKSQMCSTSDLIAPPSFTSEATQTQSNLKSIGVEVGHFNTFDRETQTVPLDNRVQTRDQAQTAQASSVDKGVLIKDHSVDHSNQASTLNKDVLSQYSPEVDSRSVQTRSNKKHPEIHFKEPMFDRTNETSSTSNSTKLSSMNSTSSGSSTTLCICCKSSTELGSLFCNSCRRKYNIYKRPESKASKDDDKTSSYCSCSKTRYCRYCRLKLARTSRSQGGLAYTLTLESFSSDVEQNSTIVPARMELEEIKMRVPKKAKHKSSKEKENYIRKSEEDMQKEKEDKTEKDKKGSYTLQEYLANNKPDFVNMADFRRLVLTNSKMTREMKGDMAKFSFLDNNTENSIPRRLFSNREMKEITRKHYTKLTKDKEKMAMKAKMKQADKLIADIFSKKLQQQVLTGKRNFPIDKVLVNFS